MIFSLFKTTPDLPTMLCGGAIFFLPMLITGCTSLPTTNIPADNVQQQKHERAAATLNEGLSQYNAGSYNEATKSFLIALDSGVLSTTEQIESRKHMAFIYCLTARQINCQEEFEKILAIDPKFDLTPAEAGHPTWGPTFLAVKTEIENKRSGKVTAPPAKPSAADKLLADGMKAYDAADYNKAIKFFQDALKENLPLAEQIKAHKFIAFSFCVTNRAPSCKMEFQKILGIQPDFDLEPAEAGHPSWGPLFRSLKTNSKPADKK